MPIAGPIQGTRTVNVRTRAAALYTCTRMPKLNMYFNKRVNIASPIPGTRMDYVITRGGPIRGTRTPEMHVLLTHLKQVHIAGPIHGTRTVNAAPAAALYNETK